MILVILLIGVVVIVAAVRNSQAALGAALLVDVPAFVTWAAAIFAVGAIGWIPHLKPVSRALLALLLTVLVVRNYQAILAGFERAWQSPPAPAAAPASGGSGGSSGGGLSFDPGQFLAAYETASQIGAFLV